MAYQQQEFDGEVVDRVPGESTALARQENGLAQRDEFAMESSAEVSRALARERTEIESAIISAHRFPRNELRAYTKLMEAMDRWSMADKAEYSFKRGKKQDPDGRWVDNYITGPTVNLIREGARCWGNVRFGWRITRDDKESRQIVAWACDLESNLFTEAYDEFNKIVQKKNYKKKVESDPDHYYVPADERELREITNRRASILLRGCLQRLLPTDFVDDALARARATIRAGIKKDPKAVIKGFVLAFNSVGVTVEMIEEYLGHPVDSSGPKEIEEMIALGQSIKSGDMTWREALAQKADDGSVENVKAKSEATQQKITEKLAEAKEKKAATTPNIISPTQPVHREPQVQATEVLPEEPEGLFDDPPPPAAKKAAPAKAKKSPGPQEEQCGRFLKVMREEGVDREEIVEIFISATGKKPTDDLTENDFYKVNEQLSVFIDAMRKRKG